MTSTERVRRWRAVNPEANRAAKCRELDRRKLRAEALREFALALAATNTKENK